MKLTDKFRVFLLWLSRTCTESRSFLLLTPPNQWAGWERTRSWEGAQLEQLTPTDQNRGKKVEEREFGVMESVFPSNSDMWWSSVFLKMAEHLPTNGKLWINSLFCFALHCAQLFLSLLNCPYLNTLRFLYFCSSYFLPYPSAGEQASSSISGLLRLNHGRSEPKEHLIERWRTALSDVQHCLTRLGASPVNRCSSTSVFHLDFIIWCYFLHCFSRVLIGV